MRRTIRTFTALLATLAVGASLAYGTSLGSVPARHAPAAAPYAFSYKARANDVRKRARHQLGVFSFRGSGKVGSGSFTGSTHTQNTPKHYAKQSITTSIDGYSFTQVHARKTLKISVTVTASTSEDDCKVGTTGTVTLVDDTAKLKNGQTKDSFAQHYPSGDCPSFEQDVNNRDSAQAEPTHGGPPSGGHWAKVSITPS